MFLVIVRLVLIKCSPKLAGHLYRKSTSIELTKFLIFLVSLLFEKEWQGFINVLNVIFKIKTKNLNILFNDKGTKKLQVDSIFWKPRNYQYF